MELLHQDLTNVILKTFYEVYNELGYGFLEKVYQNALLIELRSKGLEVSPQKKIKVFSLDGKLIIEVYSTNIFETIDLTGFARGFYIIKIEFGENTLNRKLILQ